MPGKTARALCPVCQEPMPPDETECDNCGAFVIDEAVVRLSRAFGIPREKALALFEKGFRHPKQLGDRDVDDVLEHGENGLLYLCTNCGGFVATGDPTCPRCHAEFETQEPEPAAEPRDILDIVLCPVCGADNEPAWRECEICGERLGGLVETPGPETADARTPSGQDATAGKPAGVAAGPHPDSLRLDRIDNILQDLESSMDPRADPAVRPVPRSPSGPRRAPEARQGVEAPIDTAVEASPADPGRTAAQRPVAPPQASDDTAPKSEARTVHRSVPQSHRPIHPVPLASPRMHPRRWTAPPSEYSGGIVLAAAGGLYASAAFGESGLTLGIAAIVLFLVLVVLGIALARREARLERIDIVLVSLGALLGVLASLLPTSYALGTYVAGAVVLALATRRLVATPGRDLLVVASGASLVALGVASAEGTAMATSVAWTVGLLAALPWPAAAVAEGVRLRRSTAAARREIAKAEQDLARRDYAESMKDFDRAIALGAKGAADEDLPWYGKGASLILLGRYEEALRAIDRALDLNPHNEVAWLNKGNAFTKMGRLVDALRCFNAAIQVNPDYEVAWNNKGNTLARLGHHEEALVCYERALEVDPDYRAAWVNKGFVLTKLGRYDEATSCADRVLRLGGASRTHAA